MACERWLEEFADAASPDTDAYEKLFAYFVMGFETYRSPRGANADYVGWGSYNGSAMDRLEGFSRLAPLIAAWIHGGRPTKIAVSGERGELDLVALLRSGLLAGTDTNSAEYWGAIGHWGQAIVEAADIALVLWLTRSVLWRHLERDERSQIANWLLQVSNKRIPDNNWHLFVVQTLSVLRALQVDCDETLLATHYARAKSFYRGGGWFSDGEYPDSRGFDYYNAWGFHYHLFWINRINPDLDRAFIERALADFIAEYRYLIGPEGFPMLGRSACYRMAAPVPLILGDMLKIGVCPPGQARRALDVTWQHFIRHGAVSRGAVTQGYYRADMRFIEPYSGAASCFWSLRSLIAALCLPRSHDFWSMPPGKLPVEQSDFDFDIPATGWTVHGRRSERSVEIRTSHSGREVPPPTGALASLLELLRCRPSRQPADGPRYERASYGSKLPYGCTDAASNARGRS